MQHGQLLEKRRSILARYCQEEDGMVSFRHYLPVTDGLIADIIEWVDIQRASLPRGQLHLEVTFWTVSQHLCLILAPAHPVWLVSKPEFTEERLPSRSLSLVTADGPSRRPSVASSTPSRRLPRDPRYPSLSQPLNVSFRASFVQRPTRWSGSNWAPIRYPCPRYGFRSSIWTT